MKNKVRATIVISNLTKKDYFLINADLKLYLKTAQRDVQKKLAPILDKTVAQGWLAVDAKANYDLELEATDVAFLGMLLQNDEDYKSLFNYFEPYFKKAVILLKRYDIISYHTNS